MKTCKINDFKEFESFSNEILEHSVLQFNKFLQNQEQISKAEIFKLEVRIALISFNTLIHQRKFSLELSRSKTKNTASCG
jgi:hypothetical protein